MSEEWPPEWGDPDAENLASAEQLAEVSSALAAMPFPALPDAFAARIGAAIAAESATRTEHSPATGVSATVRSVSPELSDGSSPAAAGSESATAPAGRARMGGARRAARQPARSRASGPGGSRPPGRWRSRLISPQLMGPLLIIVVIAGFGVLFSHLGGMSASSSSSAAGSGTSVNHAASGATQPLIESVPAKQPMVGSSAHGYAVTDSGTKYQRATLAGQVHAALAAIGSVTSTAEPLASPAPSAGASGSIAQASSSAASSTGVTAPSVALMGCVARLTGNRAPSLVDRATYAGKQAYIIALPTKAWVVGLGCTSANPELITTVVLAG